MNTTYFSNLICHDTATADSNLNRTKHHSPNVSWVFPPRYLCLHGFLLCVFAPLLPAPITPSLLSKSLFHLSRLILNCNYYNEAIPGPTSPLPLKTWQWLLLSWTALALSLWLSDGPYSLPYNISYISFPLPSIDKSLLDCNLLRAKAFSYSSLNSSLRTAQNHACTWHYANTLKIFSCLYHFPWR